MREICIIGVGRLGGALAIALSKAGYQVRELVVRDPRIARKVKKNAAAYASITRLDRLNRISSRTVLITSGDPEIEGITRAISPFISREQVVLHTSGSLSSSVLHSISGRGAAAGSIHPLTSISEPFSGALQFRDTYFCIEGDDRAVKRGRQIVKVLGGKPFSIDTGSKALYHASAVMAAGHVTALFDVAVKMMARSGTDPDLSKKVLLRLIRSTVSNLEREAPVNVLTGTFARLDQQAFLRHLSAFDKLPREFVRIYLELGDHSLHLVEERDGKSRPLSDLRKAISLAKANLR